VRFRYEMAARKSDSIDSIASRMGTIGMNRFFTSERHWVRCRIILGGMIKPAPLPRVAPRGLAILFRAGHEGDELVVGQRDALRIVRGGLGSRNPVRASQ
jgi:hypothetical protein